MPKCENCKKLISDESYVLHEVHCTRFLSLCNQCGESVPKSKKQEHDAEFHKKEKCPYCSKLIDKVELALHKTMCPSKPKPCDYCGAVLELHHLLEHEDQCGSRTEKCNICDKNVVMKEMPEHLAICFELLDQRLDEESKEPPKRKPAPPQPKRKGKK